MFYIGCHWGREDDGYICSSNRMRDAYRRRPHDFKRRIISRVYSNKTDLLEEEYRWLSMIKPEELKVRYYNLRQHRWGHWTSDENKRGSIRDKIKASLNDPITKKKISDAKLGDRNPMKRPDVVERRLKTWHKNNTDYKPWNTGMILGPNPEHSERMKGRSPPNKGIPMSEHQRLNRSKKWKITFPDGKEETITNLNKFCEENRLYQQNLIKVANGKRTHSGGYRCERIS